MYPYSYESGKCLLIIVMILFSPMAFAQQSGVNVTGSVVEQGSDTPSSKQRYDAERKRQCHGTRCGERP